MIFNFTIKELLLISWPFVKMLLALMLVIIVANMVGAVGEALAYERTAKQPGIFYVLVFGMILPSLSMVSGSGVIDDVFSQTAKIILVCTTSLMCLSNGLTLAIVTFAPEKYRAKIETREFFWMIGFTLIFSTALNVLSYL